MNANEHKPKNDPAAELRRAAVFEMVACIKEMLLPATPGEKVERAARVLATLKLGRQAVEQGPRNKSTERALRSVKRAIQEQEKWKAECERKLS